MLGTGVLFIDSHFVLNKFNLVAGGLGEEAESAGGVGESFGAADGSVGLKDVGACSSKGFRVGRKKEELLDDVAGTGSGTVATSLAEVRSAEEGVNTSGSRFLSESWSSDQLCSGVRDQSSDSVASFAGFTSSSSSSYSSWKKGEPINDLSVWGFQRCGRIFVFSNSGLSWNSLVGWNCAFSPGLLEFQLGAGPASFLVRWNPSPWAPSSCSLSSRSCFVLSPVRSSGRKSGNLSDVWIGFLGGFVVCLVLPTSPNSP